MMKKYAGALLLTRPVTNLLSVLVPKIVVLTLPHLTQPHPHHCPGVQIPETNVKLAAVDVSRDQMEKTPVTNVVVLT